MTKLRALLLGLLAASAAAAVVELDDTTLANAIETEPAMLLEFYAPWCGKCKTIKNEYERAGELASSLNLPFKVAKFDANEHMAIAKAFDVENVPTFYLFRNGSRSPFPLLTTGEAIVAGVSKMLDLGLDLSPVKVFDSESGLDVANWVFWRGTDDGKIMSTVMLYQPPELAGEAADASQAMFQAFEMVAKELQRFSNLRFAICRSPAAMADFELAMDNPTLVMYTDHDEGRHEFTGAAVPELLQEWVLRREVPLVTDIWHRTLQSYRKRVSKLALLFVSTPQSEHPPTLARLTEKLHEIAYSLERKGYFQRGDFTIGVADGHKYSNWMKPFGVNPKTARMPVFVVEDLESGKLYASHDISPAACVPPPPQEPSEDGEPVPSPLPLPGFCRVHAPDSSVAVLDANGQLQEGQDGGKGKDANSAEREALTWTDIPDMEMEQFLDEVFLGRIAPTKVLPPSERVKGGTQASIAAGSK